MVVQAHPRNLHRQGPRGRPQEGIGGRLQDQAGGFQQGQQTGRKHLHGQRLFGTGLAHRSGRGTGGSHPRKIHCRLFLRIRCPGDHVPAVCARSLLVEVHDSQNGRQPQADGPIGLPRKGPPQRTRSRARNQGPHAPRRIPLFPRLPHHGTTLPGNLLPQRHRLVLEAHLFPGPTRCTDGSPRIAAGAPHCPATRRAGPALPSGDGKTRGPVLDRGGKRRQGHRGTPPDRLRHYRNRRGASRERKRLCSRQPRQAPARRKLHSTHQRKPQDGLFGKERRPAQEIPGRNLQEGPGRHGGRGHQTGRNPRLL
mmetsp:Transcript_6497/g.18618  ORF Transcript_6497/g.18618 Transcript_6497/m.18618 type:complete len:310 (-) Transcript_6497:2354-3283(-)